MSSGFHRLGANAKAIGWSNSATYGLGSAPPPDSPACHFDVDPQALSGGALVTTGLPKLTKAQAKTAGFTGNSCAECGSMQMVRNGTCEKCNACGATTGCS